jgi:hypothetical protein
MRHFAAIACLVLLPGSLFAQLAPEIGFVHPAGGQPGTTIGVTVGGYDWTPDTQIFVHDSRVKLEIVGPSSGVLVPDPPYWFGNKARGNDRPLPREFPARLTLPADMPPGLVKFQVANANGASPPGVLHVGRTATVVEDAKRKSAQALPQLPITVSGQIRCIEEIDRYEFTTPSAGPVTLEIFARRLGSPLHAVLKVVDSAGKTVLDKADLAGRDFAASFIAQANANYAVSLHDVDFAGDRSYVYRLTITPGARVLAAFPAAGRVGETREIEFLGLGLATGGKQIESLKQAVTFPSTEGPFEVSLDTPHGKSLPFMLTASTIPEHVKPAQVREFSLPSLPCAVTAALDDRFGADRLPVSLAKDQRWSIAAVAQAMGSPLDLDLSVLDATGKELARSDDSPGSTDPRLSFAAPADGAYTFVVSDSSGSSGVRTANYRLVVEVEKPDFAFSAPTQLAVTLGSTAKLPLKVVRQGGFKGPIEVSVSGQPQGISVPADLKFAENGNDLAIDLTSEPNAAAAASLATVTATAEIEGQKVTRTATVLIASIMKPRIKLVPEGLDDVRKVHRGSTFLAPVLIERLEGFQGEIVLEMTAKQQRSRQGMKSEEFTVPADAQRIEYPIFVPEWMETTKTSRMILNGAVKVVDPQGNVRTLLQRQELRIGLLPEGALLKLRSQEKEIAARLGSTVEVPLALFRAAEFYEPAKLELVGDDLPQGILAETATIEAQASGAVVKLLISDDARLIGEHTLKFRATALKDGRWPVIAEATLLLVVAAK